MTQQPKKLLDQVRDAIRLKHHVYSTEKTTSIGSSALSSIATNVIRWNWVRRRSVSFSPTWP